MGTAHADSESQSQNSSHSTNSANSWSKEEASTNVKNQLESGIEMITDAVTGIAENGTTAAKKWFESWLGEIKEKFASGEYDKEEAKLGYKLNQMLKEKFESIFKTKKEHQEIHHSSSGRSGSGKGRKI